MKCEYYIHTQNTPTFLNQSTINFNRQINKPINKQL